MSNPGNPCRTQAWHLSGDLYSKKPGEKPWISEMYGYVFGAAKLNIWHKWDEASMIYPGYMPTGGWVAQRGCLRVLRLGIQAGCLGLLSAVVSIRWFRL